MNQQSYYKMLCDDLEQIASEVLNDQEPACNFSDDQDVVEFEADFNLWEDR